jgi:hypothetical protein
MNIVKQKWEFLNKTVEYVPLQVRRLYRFGLETLVGRNIVSMRANARLVPLTWNTAKSKVYRLSSNARIPEIFVMVLKSLSLVVEKDIISVDFSDFGNGFQILMFAKQTRRGRAIPLYFEILEYPILRNSQNLFIIQAIRNFSRIVGCKPKLVFDRGFACPALINFMAQNQYIFIIRIKKGKSAKNLKTEEVFLVKESKENDNLVGMYGKKLRLVISDQLRDMREPWYLITNDFKSSRGTIIDEYYHRFEIEEFFRDAKRLLGLEYVNFNKSLSLSIALWFTILGIWFFNHLDSLMDENDRKAKEAMRLSTIRYCFEKLQREYVISLEAEYLINCG